MKTEEYQKEYFTNDEVAAGVAGLIKISKNTLRNARWKRQIRFTKVGNMVVYKREWIQAYLDRNEVATIA